MHRIDTDGAVGGQFSDGDPSVPRLATVLDAAWANAIQEEIISVIAGAGIGLNKADYTLLLQAIISLIQARIADHVAAANPHPQYALTGHTHDTRYVRFDAAQVLTLDQQAQARDNIVAASVPLAFFMGQM